MTDLSKTIAPKSDQQNYDDFLSGPKTITVTRVVGNEDPQQPISIFFEGDNGKPYKPGLSMRRVLVQVWGPDGDEYIGRSMTLYGDPDVKFGGIRCGGIRISNMSDIPKEIALMLTKTRGKKGEYRVKPLILDTTERALSEAEEAAQQGKDKFLEFYNSDFGKANRDAIKAKIEHFQKIAAEADEAKKPLSERLQGASEREGSPEQPSSSSHCTDELDLSGAFPGSDEYGEGMAAAEDGKEKNCPYEAGTQKAVDWLAGYEEAP